MSDAINWNGLDTILRHARSKNESCSLELTNWIADNKARADLPSEVDGLIEECIKYIKNERLPCCFGVDEKEIVADVVRYIVKQSSHY